MINKIISGGQTGADRAALDVAIRLGIAHGGWVPKGSWKSYFIGITKDTLNPVINFKGGIAHRASGITLPGFNTLARTKRAV